MFSKKLGFALGAVMIFLAIVAFILGRPPHRDARLYPLIRQYTPFVVEKNLGGLVIRRKDNPKFKVEPDAVNFYPQLQELERNWAAKHLSLKGDTLTILDDQGKPVKSIQLRNEKEKRFIRDYYQVKPQ